MLVIMDLLNTYHVFCEYSLRMLFCLILKTMLLDRLHYLFHFWGEEDKEEVPGHIGSKRQSWDLNLGPSSSWAWA